MINELIKLADSLDRKAMLKESDLLDNIIQKLAFGDTDRPAIDNDLYDAITDLVITMETVRDGLDIHSSKSIDQELTQEQVNRMILNSVPELIKMIEESLEKIKSIMPATTIQSQTWE
jgi:hypothetical protein